MGRLAKYDEVELRRIFAFADKYGDEAAVDAFEKLPSTAALRGLRNRNRVADSTSVAASMFLGPTAQKPNGNGNGHKEAPEMPKMPPHRPKAKRRLLRVGVFDIETQSFDAIGEDGVFTCGCILPLASDEIITSRLEYNDKGDDRRALVEFIGHLWQFDVLIGHNITAFDLNWLNTRRMYHGMPDLRSWLMFDTYQASRAIAMSSGGKSLGNLEDVFGLEGVKTTIRKTTWSKARSQNREVFEATLAQTIYHCEQDVIGQRELFDVLLPYAMTLNTNQFKQTKWKLGIPSWDGWLAHWRIAEKEVNDAARDSKRKVQAA